MYVYIRVINLNLGDPNIFEHVPSLLDPNTQMGKMLTHAVSVDEINRRCGPPENMAMRHLLSYIRTGGQNRQAVKEKIEATNINISSKSGLLTSFSRLTEGESIIN